MIGKPKFKMGEIVQFQTINKEGLSGEIVVIDKYGVFEDDTDVHYDILSPEENCVYKHIKETNIIKSI